MCRSTRASPPTNGGAISAICELSALFTRATWIPPSREVAHALGIPIIDLSPRPSEGPGAFSLVGPRNSAIADDELASSTDDAFILLTSGTSSRAKDGPTDPCGVCRSAYNVGATLALGPRDRLLNVLPLFHVHGLVSGLLAALAAGSSVVCTSGFDAAAFFGWLKEFRPTWYTAVPAIHRAVLSAADAAQAQRAQRCSLRVDSLGFFVSAARRDRRAGSPVRCPGDRYLRHDGSRFPDCRKPLRATQARFGRPARRGRDRDHGPRGPTAAAGKRGEIALRGPTITQGYDNDAAATAVRVSGRLVPNR